MALPLLRVVESHTETNVEPKNVGFRHANINIKRCFKISKDVLKYQMI